jgi:hypothetical protein
MSTPRTNPCTQKPPRIYRRIVRQLTRMRERRSDPASRTLCLTTPDSGQGNSRCTFVDPEHVPDFEGESAWFEMELVEGVPWSYWRAVRQVDPPAHARAK